MTLPILYESVTIIPEPESIMDANFQPPSTPLCVPSVSIFSDRLHHLHETVSGENGQKLALLTKAFFMHPALWGQQRQIAERTMDEIRTLLPYLSNLQRLSIIHINPRLKDVIPMSMLLTHLDISSDSENEVLDVLARQPALRVLSINIMTFLPLPQLERTVNLPDLHTYQGPSSIWKCIYATSPFIQSLFSDIIVGGVEHVHSYYSNLRNLDISSSELQTYHLILPRLHRIEYIRVKTSDLAVKPGEFLGYLRQIPSQSLKYLLIRTVKEVQTGVCQPMVESIFRETPSLRIIDIKSPRRRGFSMSFETTRYTHTGPPHPVDIPSWNLFGWWWHSIEDDLHAVAPA
ncbi:hypothetical protein ONZ45_g4733 [Pleurotus djamor]|nr:hypothetical protein ONZ45_g4733 [Pleurotus djamor]